MNADIQGALDQLDDFYHCFEHKGKRLSKEYVEGILRQGLSRGYTHTGQFTDDEVDAIIHRFDMQVIRKHQLEATQFVMPLDAVTPKQ
jgi:hypothetical protein